MYCDGGTETECGRSRTDLQEYELEYAYGGDCETCITECAERIERYCENYKAESVDECPAEYTSCMASFSEEAGTYNGGYSISAYC